MIRILFIFACWMVASAIFLLNSSMEVHAKSAKKGNVETIILVDTSKSMHSIDPMRASMLVTKLLVDIVPGELAVGRLLDTNLDATLLPHTETDEIMKCPDSGVKCRGVIPTENWHLLARKNLYGLERRPGRGDIDFKQRLETHLEQKSNNSPFAIAFRAAQGFLDTLKAKSATSDAANVRSILWLSDGDIENDRQELHMVIKELQHDQVAIEAIVFGKGSTAFAKEAGLRVTLVNKPHEIMRAFADAFRRIVQAPYEMDQLLAIAPTFDIKSNVQEAWIIVYGNPGLKDVTLTAPDGRVLRADYASDQWEQAGAYRVAYLNNDPQPGKWRISVIGGDKDTAYAVIQRSALEPSILSKKKFIFGVPAPIVVGLTNTNGQVIQEPEVLSGATVTVQWGKQKLNLKDNGNNGDQQAGDGRFSAMASFSKIGNIPVEITFKSDFVDSKNQDTLESEGVFKNAQSPVTIHLGTLKTKDESCRPLPLQVEHQGAVALQLIGLHPIPEGHTLQVRLPTANLEVNGEAVTTLPFQDQARLCLTTTERAPISEALGEAWLRLQPIGSQDLHQAIVLQLHWHVDGLTWWELWRNMIFAILAVLVFLIFIGGFILPKRFDPNFAITIVESMDEIEDFSPRPVNAWKGVGIGWYRNGRAFIHSDYTLNGKEARALVGLYVESNLVRVMSGKGTTLFQGGFNGIWEAVPPQGQSAHAGDLFRVGDNGLFFRIAIGTWT